jgi:LacI family transcriptional regulator
VLVAVDSLDKEPVFERLRGVLDALRDTDLDAVVALIATAEDRDRFVARHTINDKAAGVLLIDVALGPTQAAMLADANVPVVAVGDRAANIPSVFVDNVKGGRIATRHLIELGHERIAFLGDDKGSDVHSPFTCDRHTGHVAELDDHGVSHHAELTRLGPRTPEAIASMTEELLNLASRPTAVVAATYQHALGALLATRSSGVRVPEELSIIGFEDGEAARYAGLTTVTEPMLQSGIYAGKLLLSLTRDQDPPDLEHELDLEFATRETTAPPLP